MSASDKKATKQNAPRTRGQGSLINGSRLILEVKGKEPGYHYSWIGEPDVYAAVEDGFEHVRHPVQVGNERLDVSRMNEDSFVTRNVGGMKIAYLMRIPEDLYKEYMNEIDQRTNDQERARVRDSSTSGLSGEIKVRT